LRERLPCEASPHATEPDDPHLPCRGLSRFGHRLSSRAIGTLVEHRASTHFAPRRPFRLVRDGIRPQNPFHPHPPPRGTSPRCPARFGSLRLTTHSRAPTRAPPSRQSAPASGCAGTTRSGLLVGGPIAD